MATLLEGLHPHSETVQEEITVYPGFRFHPTEEELLAFYLKKRVQGAHLLNLDILIPTVDLYRYDPWELQGLVHDVGEKQWFFFVPREHKKSARPSRLTVSGYWKATGSDTAVRNERLQCIGLKKILVFYKGKAPLGQRTGWIMNEYRMPDLRSSVPSKKKVDMVLCRIYRKAASQKSMEQRTKPDPLEKNKLVVLTGDGYEEKCNSINLNGSSCQSNPMTETKIPSLYYNENQKGVCSSDIKMTKKDASCLFECLEPIIFCTEETMGLKTVDDSKQLQLELPKVSMDCLFSEHTETSYVSEQIETSYDLMSDPSLLEFPLF